ncbi:MAG: hypothetical protein HYZ54_06005 [Ignavibacteriae bacterium]|nr:hypothetical protein [Ignavibacteriota bacterium]
MKNNPLKTYTLEELTGKHIGKLGTPKRDAFENKLHLDLQNEEYKQMNKEQNLTLNPQYTK